MGRMGTTMSAYKKSARSRQGFTLVEMLVGVTVSMMVIALVFTSFILQRRVFEAQQRVNEMQQNVRTATDVLVHDLHMAGYGLKGIPPYKTGDWVDWVAGMTDNPMVIQGAGSAPDTVVVAGAFDEPVADLQTLATNRTTTIRVSSGQGSEFNTTDKKVIYIGRTETARIVGVAGDTLTISIHPTLSKGLRYDYQPGTPIELVRVVRYEIRNPVGVYPFEPHLIREMADETYTAEWHKMCAGNIEDLQITRNTHSVDLALTGRTSKPDRYYTHPVTGDHFRRMDLTRRIQPRNARLWK